jgi:hypothetical protein
MTGSSPNEPSNLKNPMSVGDILKTGWRLYIAHFSKYCLIALIATIWSLIPTVFNLLTTFVPSYFGTSVPPGIAILAFVVWVAIAIYCGAQALGEFAGISRITYELLNNPLSHDSETLRNDLSASSSSGTNLSEATSLERALQFTRSRKFSFLGASILQSIILFLTGLALFITTAIFFAVVGGIAGAIAGTTGMNPIIGLLFLLLFIGWLIACISTYLYVLARFMLFEQPLAIEPETDTFGSLSRSMDLTEHGVGRTMLVAFLLNLLALIIILIPIGVVSVLVPTDLIAILSTENPDPELVASAFLPFYLAIVITSIVISIGLVPLFKTTFTTLYFDLRNRLERRTFRENMRNQSPD